MNKDLWKNWKLNFFWEFCAITLYIIKQNFDYDVLNCAALALEVESYTCEIDLVKLWQLKETFSWFKYEI